jgi:hypothetical protein
MLSEEVDVSAVDKLVRPNAQLVHQIPRNGFTGLGIFAFRQNHFQFHEVAEAFHAIQMDAGSSRKKKGSMFSNASRLAIGH